MHSRGRRLLLAPIVLSLALGAAGPASAGGSGGLGSVTAAPRTLKFVRTAVGAYSDRLSFWVTNNTKAPLIVTGVTLGGRDQDDFIHGAGAGFTTYDCYFRLLYGELLNPGESCGYVAGFHPTEVGQHAATLTISFSDGVRRFDASVALSGAGS
jgi:hypothetical protein